MMRRLDAAAPFMDKSFAPLGQELVRSDLEVFRAVGYKVLGLARNPADRQLLEKGLLEKEVPLLRAALIGLGELGDAAAVPAIEEYLRRGSEKLLAGFHWDQVARQAVAFRCRCSAERVISVLASLQPDELRELIEGLEQLESTCDFCQTTWTTPVHQLLPLLEASS